MSDVSGKSLISSSVADCRKAATNSTGICSIIPPHVLRALAATTTEVAEEIREAATELIHYGPEHDASPATEHVPVQAFSLSYAKPESATGRKQRRRLIRAVYNSSKAPLPGALVRWEGQPATGDAGVDECFDGFGAFFDFYYDVLGRNSIDDAGMYLVGSVHDRCKLISTWNGSQVIFGDGDGTIFTTGGFTKALEVVAHALAHGVTDYTAALSYHGETGALNESISDVFGTVVKQYALCQKVTDADWLIGSGLFTPQVSGVALRSLKAPGTAYDDPRLGGKDPQVAHMSRYVVTCEDRGGAHINSGIANHAFYLVAMDFGSYSWEKAGKIWYDALTNGNLPPYATFKQFAELTCDAALKLFGSDARVSVCMAWTEVGVFAPSPNFTTVYQQGEPGNGIAGYNLKSAADRAFAFDYDHSGKLDHLVLYRPATGTLWIIQNNNGVFSPVYKEGDPGNGIGGYNLKSAADRVFAFDYDHSGKLDHLALYRPGTGTFWILKNNKGVFSAVFAEGDPGRGIGGYDLKSAADRAFAFDYDHSGKQDHVVLYRPGAGTMWILKNVGGKFSPVYAEGAPGKGIGGYDLASPVDRAFAFDFDHSGKKDHIALYRPGTGTIWIMKNEGGKFSPVYNRGDPGIGIGGYNLRSPNDRVFEFDYDGSGKLDCLALYRPPTGTIWILKHVGEEFVPVYKEGDPGNGIARYNLKSPADRVFCFDYSSKGTMQNLVLYRPGTGTIWILKRKHAC